jgi:arylesterase/paraoxonase
MMKRWLWIGLAVMVLLAGAWVGDLLRYSGHFKKIEPHFGGECRTVIGLVGAEDITTHPETGVAYISACDRRAVMRGEPGRGAVYAYDLKAASPLLVNLTPDADADFQPHGISLFVAADGPDLLFVINHQGGQNRIAIYEIGDQSLVLRQSLTDPLLVSPNDLVAVGPNQCYVTNDHRYVTGLARIIEDYGRRRLANIVFFDGRQFAEVATGIGYPNGINVSPDGRTLYLAATIEKALHIFDRDPTTNMLNLREIVPLGTGVDNIEVDREGGLWIGAHPQLLRFVSHSKDPGRLSPSQILHVTFMAGGGYVVEEVYLDRGEALSASSVGSVSGQRMLIGAVFDRKMLDCHLPNPPESR